VSVPSFSSSFPDRPVLEHGPAPGVPRAIERRAVLCGAAAVSGLAALPPEPSPAGSALETPGELAWERFTAVAPPLLTALAAGERAADLEAYLHALASLAVRTSGVPRTELKAFAGVEPEAAFGMLHRARPFFVVQWRLAPGAVYPAHCHPGYSVCTVALAGSAEVRHYEPEPGAPAFDAEERRPFLLRETRRQRLVPGAISTLAPTRDNLHRFQAGPDGALGIDLTTPHGGDGRFSFASFDAERPRDPAARLYEATWIGSKLG